MACKQSWISVHDFWAQSWVLITAYFGFEKKHTKSPRYCCCLAFCSLCRVVPEMWLVTGEGVIVGRFVSPSRSVTAVCHRVSFGALVSCLSCLSL